MALAQTNIGINTDTPLRPLDARHTSMSILRMHDEGNIGGEAGLELVLSANNATLRDYRFTNDAGALQWQVSDDAFATAGQPLWHFNFQGYMGLGTTSPSTRLHLSGGGNASNAGAGYFTIGSITGKNLVFDQNDILARNNGSASALTLQGNNGATYIGENGGNVLLADGGGSVGIGTTVLPARLSIEDENFQLAFINLLDEDNSWYLGTTNGGWTVGDNRLVFSPTTSSNDAVLRLVDVTENNGTIAPVMIRSGASQTLLLDGNEIDGLSDAIHINRNSQQHTLLNVNGGRVGVGTDDPTNAFEVRTSGTDPALRLEDSGKFWEIDANTEFNWLGFRKNGFIVGRVNGITGQWETISDRRVKQDIRPLEPVLDRLLDLTPLRYRYKGLGATSEQIGLIAQDVAPIFPEIAVADSPGIGVAYSKLSVLLLKALQEQQAEIDRLSTELHSLMTSTSN
jgi:hypothetical protein